MKVNGFGMLTNLVVICAVSQFVLLSAANVPLSDEQKLTETTTTPATATLTTQNTTETVMTTKAAEIDSYENASVEGSVSADTMPPKIFPTDEEKILSANETALKILQKVSSQTSEESKSNETLKLTTLPSEVTTTTAPSVTISIDTTTNETSNSTIAKETTEDDYDAEDVQKTTDQEQEELEEEFGKTGSDKATIFTEPVTNEKVLHSGHIALIFASTLVVFSVLAYIGLILWRSRLESRYGMRQQLVTEDDYYNNNDVRYFGL